MGLNSRISAKEVGRSISVLNFGLQECTKKFMEIDEKIHTFWPKNIITSFNPFILSMGLISFVTQMEVGGLCSTDNYMDL